MLIRRAWASVVFTEALFFVVPKCFWTVVEEDAYGGNIIVGFVTDNTFGERIPPNPLLIWQG